MFKDTAQDIFDRFRATAVAEGVYPASLTHADGMYMREIRRWVDGTYAFDVPLSEVGENKYTRGWLLRPYITGAGRSDVPVKKSTKAALIAVSTISGCIEAVFVGASTSVLNPEGTPRFLENALIGQSRREVIPARDIVEIDDYIKNSSQVAKRRLEKQIAAVSKKLKVKSSHSNEITRCATTATDPFVSELFQFERSKVDEFIALDDFEFIRSALTINSDFKSGTAIKIYNHLQRSPSAQAKDYRKGAMTVLIQLGHSFFGDLTLWQDIDVGLSIHDALAKKFKVQKATIRQGLKTGAICNILGNGRLQSVLKHIDHIDVARWPRSEEDIRYFELAFGHAQTNAAAFGKTTADYLRQYAGQLDLDQKEPWRSFINQITASTVEQYEDLKKQTIEYDRASRALNIMARAINNIRDMKADVKKKIVIPAVIHEMEQHGYTVLKMDGIDPVVTEISNRMWASSPRSEQVAASSYWHSPRVNFTGRIQSVAYSSTTGMSWVGVVKEPIEAENGLTLHPLNSDPALRAEGHAMNHCVGGYAYNCLKFNYHVFSVRNGDKRVSTLTVEDFIEDGKRKIKKVENSAHSNVRPSAKSEASGQWLIHMINEGKLKPDWEAVDDSKAEFLAKEVDLAVGYDFREEGQRQRIFEVFEPCLPRKALSKHGRTADELMQGLGLSQLVTSYLDKDNLAELGIRQDLTANRPAITQNEQLRLG